MAVVGVMAGCSGNKNQPEQKAVPEKVAVADEPQIKLAEGMLVSKNDTMCGMEIGNEPGDTLTYDGKLFGFCSSGCKDAFKTQYVKK